MAKPWRPSIDDVDSISRGGPAKVRGTGSRRIPHRLNAEERTLYDLGKKKGFLAVRGTAYRKFRHGNPLPNIFRQWCDARGQLCVVVEQDPLGAGGTDRVVVDLAPLRAEDDDAQQQAEAALTALAAEAGLRRVPYDERPPDALPFNILPPGGDPDAEEAEDAQIEHLSAVDLAKGTASGVSSNSEATARRSGSGEASSSSSSVGISGPGEDEQIAALRRAVAAQAEAVRQLKAQGGTNKDPVVQDGVRVLQALKASLAQAEAAALAPVGSSPAPVASTPPPPPSPPQDRSPSGHANGQTAAAAATGPTQDANGPTAGDAAAASGCGAPLRAPRRSPVEHYYQLPIWQIHAVPLFFEGSRAAAKQFASQAAQRVVAEQGARRTPGAGTAAPPAAAATEPQPLQLQR